MAFARRVLTRVGKFRKQYVHEYWWLRSICCNTASFSSSGPDVGSSDVIRGVCQPQNCGDKYNTRNVFSCVPQQIRRYTSEADSLCRVDKAEISTNGRHLVVKWNDGTQSLYHSVWLRHNCHCPSCREKNSGQKLLDVSTIPANIHLDRVILTGNNLHLTWGGKNEHTGELPASFLGRYDYSDTALNKQHQASRIDEKCWTKKIPEMQYDDILKSDEGLLRFLTTVNINGLCLLKDVPQEEEHVSKVAQRIWPYMENTIYGETFDVVSTPKPINVAYSSLHIDYHIDLVYYESPPGLQMLHAVRFDECVGGGESTFLDIFHAAQLFRETNPQQFQTLVRIPASFHKVHYDRELPVHMTRQQPHFVLNHHDEIVRVNWAPPFEAPLAVNQDDVDEYYTAYEAFAKAIRDSRNCLKMRMRAGDMIVFNNRRMVHGREKFELNGGVRFLKGAYVHIDHFKSRLQTLTHLLGDGRLVNQVGNGDWF